MRKKIACFVMSDPGHFRGVLRVVEQLTKIGALVKVWTDPKFRSEVEAVGAEFANLYTEVTVEQVDNSSRPLPMRFVTFAAAAATGLAGEVDAWGANLVLHGSFALVGRVVADLLRLPRVQVASGHAVEGQVFRAKLRNDPRVAVSPACREAVRRLQLEFGLTDASPFAYVADPSPSLNIYREPKEWLDEGQRDRLGPLAYFGSLQDDAISDRARRGSSSSVDGFAVYAAFGTVAWRYWPAQMADALLAIAKTISRSKGARLSIGLGGGQIDDATRTVLEQSGAVVSDFANQWDELSRADLFITHHGLGSTHESVAKGVPMLSYPIFWDQPACARRSQELGLAVPLIESDASLPGRLDPEMVDVAIGRFLARRTEMSTKLDAARQWERATIEQRPKVAQQILTLCD